MIKYLLPLLFVFLPVFDVQIQAQVFPNAFWNKTSSCSGSLTSGRLFSRMQARRTSRIQARTQTASCGGLTSYTQQTASCSGNLSASYGSFSDSAYQAVPQAVYYQPAQSYDVYYSQPTTQPLPQQSTPQIICDGNTCTVVTNVVPVVPNTLPNNLFIPIPTTKPSLSKSFSPATKSSTAPSPTLFGLSASNDSLTIPSHVLAQIAHDETFGLSSTIPNHILGQVNTQPTKVAESFKPSLLKAISDARKSGKLNVRDAVKLRVACLSPSFVERAHELAVTQMAFNGEASDAVPTDEEGMIQTEGINWEGLAKFLEVFVPLLINLLKAFGL